MVADPATTSAPVPVEPPLVPLRRNKDFQALWTSEAFAAVAKESAEFAYPLLILASTGSALWAGTVASIQLVVAGLVSWPAGHLVDKVDRKLLLIVCNTARVLLLTLFAGLIVSGHTNLGVILGVAVVAAIFYSVAQPTGIAAIKALVPREQVTAAISQNQIRFFGATVIGPPIGGALFGLAHGAPYLGAALGFLLSTALLLVIRRPMQAVDTITDPGKRGAVDGFRFIRRQPVLLMSLIWIMGSNMMFNHTGVFIALAATGREKGAASVVIGVTVAFAGGGGLLGSFLASWVLRRFTPYTVMAYAAWIGPLAAIGLTMVPGLLPMGVLVGLVFFRGPIVSALFLAYVAALAPDRLQGRVLGAVFFLSMIVQPIGIFAIGAIFDAGGPGAVFTTVAVVTTLIALVTLTPTIRHLPRPEQLKEAVL